MKKTVLLFFCLGLFFSCKESNFSNKEISDATLEFTDYYNRKVKVKQKPQTVVSISPGITEILFDLGVGNKIIGRTIFCNFPKEALQIEAIGGISDANLERIIALRPQIVITSSMVRKDLVENIEKAGISIICLPERSNIEGVFGTIKILGKIFDKENTADSLINNMKNQLNEIKSTYNDNSYKPSIYYVVGYGATGDFTAGRDTYINEIIELSGGRNIANNISNWSYSKEELFAQQPDYIIVRQEDLNHFINTAPYKDLKAVKEKKVLGINSSLIDCQTCRSIEAIRIISNFIHQK
ncbi:MAG: ABC transporter substrate-binding protein [Bacteroidales bacterium]|nr:ABC transporter substrate-binding protein [Bacteroidales bacterium]MEE1142322.1 ABC transporter substrate-binding protein [Bacteroidales bacterium]